MSTVQYCSDCALWDTRSPSEFLAGLGQCPKHAPGHFLSGNEPRNCVHFKPATEAVIEFRMRALNE